MYTRVPSTHIYDTWISWLATCTSRKRFAAEPVQALIPNHACMAIRGATRGVGARGIAAVRRRRAVCACERMCEARSRTVLGQHREPLGVETLGRRHKVYHRTIRRDLYETRKASARDHASIQIPQRDDVAVAQHRVRARQAALVPRLSLHDHGVMGGRVANECSHLQCRRPPHTENVVARQVPANGANLVEDDVARECAATSQSAGEARTDH